MNKRILSVILALVLALSCTTTAFAATGKTVTFQGGHIFKTEKGKLGTIQLKLTNITKIKKNVKIDLNDYIDDLSVGDIVFDYTEDDEAITLADVIAAGVTVYYADKFPVTITAKSAMSCFWFLYTGNVEKIKFTPQYYDLNDYLSNPNKAKVLTKKPDGDYLVAPGTTTKITKAGKYLFVVQDDGMIDNSTVSAFCVIVK